MPSFILIHPTVRTQYTNVTDRQTDRQTDNGLIAQSEPFYKRSPKKHISVFDHATTTMLLRKEHNSPHFTIGLHFKKILARLGTMSYVHCFPAGSISMPSRWRIKTKVFLVIKWQAIFRHHVKPILHRLIWQDQIGQAAVKVNMDLSVYVFIAIIILSIGCKLQGISSSPGVRDVAVLGQIEILKMASKIVAAMW